MKLSRTLVYFLIFTLVSSIVAYKLVIASYEQFTVIDESILGQ